MQVTELLLSLLVLRVQIPKAKSIIFYNHYDTVPADGDQPWTEDPFTLSVRDRVMYGRG